MRRTLASPIFAISSKRPSAIFAEVLSASMRTARRGERASEGMTATRIQSNGGFHMRVAPLNNLIFNRITIQSDRSMAAGGLLRPGTVCRSSCYTFLPRLRPIRSSAVRFAADSPLEGDGFELVWGFSCQVVVFGLLPVLCSEREGPFFVPSPAIRFPKRAEGVKGPKR